MTPSWLFLALSPKLLEKREARAFLRLLHLRPRGESHEFTLSLTGASECLAFSRSGLSRHRTGVQKHVETFLSKSIEVLLNVSLCFWSFVAY